MFEFKAGDIAACFGNDLTSRVISLGTTRLFAPKRLRRGPSHVAILCKYHDLGMIWLESTSLCQHDCLFRGLRMTGVQAHYPLARIADYETAGGRVDLYRLVEIDRFSGNESKHLSSILMKFLSDGVGYDTAGAILSGERVLKWTGVFGSSRLESLFCSELVAAVLQRLNRMNRANPAKFNPANLLRTLVRQGTYRFETSEFHYPKLHEG